MWNESVPAAPEVWLPGGAAGEAAPEARSVQESMSMSR
jgi:hypothetical protein